MIAVKTKILATSILTVLILSAIIWPTSISLAQDTGGNENQPEATESLLKLLEQSKNYVLASFGELEERGVAIPEGAKEMYSEGSELAAMAEQFRDAGEHKEAQRVALQAMQKFREALMEIADEMEETESPEEKEVYRLKAQVAARNRAQLYINNLETQADKAEELGYNVTGIRETLTEARSYISNATNLTQEGDTDKAAAEVGKAISTAAKTMGELQPIVKANKNKQAQNFLEQAQERLKNMEEKIEEQRGQIPYQEQQSINMTIGSVRHLLEEAETLLQVGNVDDAVGKFREMNRNMLQLQEQQSQQQESEQTQQQSQQQESEQTQQQSDLN